VKGADKAFEKSVGCVMRAADGSVESREKGDEEIRVGFV
jgi:hypothetical protein